MTQAHIWIARNRETTGRELASTTELLYVLNTLNCTCNGKIELNTEIGITK
jgi:hypothetical protein